MNANAERPVDTSGDSDRIAHYVAKLVAQAPPLSAVTRAKLAAVLGAASQTKRAA